LAAAILYALTGIVNKIIRIFAMTIFKCLQSNARYFAAECVDYRCKVYKTGKSDISDISTPELICCYKNRIFSQVRI